MGFGSSFKKFIGAINPTVAIGTGAQIAGDYMAKEAAKSEGSADRRHQDDVNLANQAFAREMADRSENVQREFAQMGVRWRAADAEAAGIHPLAALGMAAPGASGFSPVSIDAGPSSNGARSHFLSSMGQNISRALQATMTRDEREKSELLKTRMGLENDLLRAQILNISRPNNPPFPEPYYEGPLGGPRIYSDAPRVPGNPEVQAGTTPDYIYTKTRSGLRPQITRESSEAMETQPFGATDWFIRNRLVPRITGGRGLMPPNPKQYPLPNGAYAWKYSRLANEWRPAYLKNKGKGRYKLEF